MLGKPYICLCLCIWYNIYMIAHIYCTYIVLYIFFTNDHGICSTCRKHYPVFSSFMTCYRLGSQINTTGVTSEAGTAYTSEASDFTPGFSGVRVTRSLVLFVCFVDRCLSFFFWPLCCLSFFDLRIMITPLVSSSNHTQTMIH